MRQPDYFEKNWKRFEAELRHYPHIAHFINATWNQTNNTADAFCVSQRSYVRAHVADDVVLLAFLTAELHTRHVSHHRSIISGWPPGDKWKVPKDAVVPAAYPMPVYQTETPVHTATKIDYSAITREIVGRR